MATFLKGLRGNDELREMLRRIESGKSELNLLVERAETSARELNRISGPLLETRRTMDVIERRLKTLEEDVSVVDSLRVKLANVEKSSLDLAATQSRVESQLAKASENVERIVDRMVEVEANVDQAQELKQEISEFLTHEAPFRGLRKDADELGRRVRDAGDGLNRLRERQDEMSRSYQQAVARLESLEADQQEAARGTEETSRRAAEIQATLAEMGDAAKEVVDTRHQLTTLNSLADQVAQKTAALEKQRDAIDRAADQASHLAELMREIESGRERHDEYRDALTAIESDLVLLQSQQEAALTRTEEIAAHQKEIETSEQAAARELADLNERLRRNVERFELDNRGLENVSQRIADLRSSLTDCESRFVGLEKSGADVSELSCRANALVAQVNSISGDLQKLSDEGERACALRSDLEGLSESVDSLSGQVGRLEEARPAIDAGLRDLGNLNRSRETVKENLEQMRSVHNEIMRVREEQSETETWLTNTDGTLKEFRDRVRELFSMRPALESVSREVERASEAMSSIESRREFVEEVHGRLGELGSLAAEIDARSKGMLARMDTVETRFTALSSKAEDAERVADQMEGVSAAVEEADQRMTEVAKVIYALENRSEHLQSLSERVRFIGRELDQRQAALEKATEHLARASTLRQEAADDVQRLEQMTHSLGDTIGSVEERAERLDALSGGLDDRARRIERAEGRIAGFESQLVKWERSESELSQALGQLESRQTTVDTLQADIKHMFEMAERTVESARSIASAQREIEMTRGELEVVVERLRAAEKLGDSLEGRKRKIERAEGRLARADALLIEIQSSLETLESQKTLVEYVVEKAGALTFQVKHAEALIDTLREERELTGRMKSAFDRLVDDPDLAAEAS
jgi:chromosome segregation protein